MIYTLSYTGTTLAALTAFLEAKNAILVDVRYQPFSRNPQWTRKTLTAALGSRYAHVGTLGNRNYKSGPIAIVDLDAGTETVRKSSRHQRPSPSCACAPTSIAATARA